MISFTKLDDFSLLKCRMTETQVDIDGVAMTIRADGFMSSRRNQYTVEQDIRLYKLSDNQINMLLTERELIKKIGLTKFEGLPS